MGQGGIEVVLVRKSGPVQTMTFKTWWIYFLFVVLVLMLVGLGAGSYLLHRQQQSLSALANDMRLMMLRTERLEALVQEQETREVLAMQAAAERAAAEAAALAREALKPKPKPKLKEEPKKPEAATSMAPAEKKPVEETPTAPPPVQTAKEGSPEATESDIVEIRSIHRKKAGGELMVSFNVANKKEPSEQAIGYVTLVARGKRGSKPWIEAWPPQRLTPLGRPMNYRRGTPFSVQRYRSMRASFALNDKVFERIEFVVFSRQGDLLLVQTEDMKTKNDQGADTKSTGDSG